jgi:ATP-dependent DNA helicase RecG
MERQVMELLKNAELSKSEIARALGKEKPTRYLNDLMKKLLENGQLVYTIPEKPNSRLQKYRITDQGKVLIQEKGAGNE